MKKRLTVKNCILLLCVLLSAAGIVFLVVEIVDLVRKETPDNSQNYAYSGFVRRWPLENVSLMIPEEFEVVKPNATDVMSSGESVLVPYNEYYTWDRTTYTGMICVTSEPNTLTPAEYVDAWAIDQYEEYYSELDYELLKREEGTVGSYPVAALTIKYSVEYEMNVTKTFNAYCVYIQNNGSIYVVTCVCQDWDFERCKPLFEQICAGIDFGIAEAEKTGGESAQSQ